jgi:hypothetical protein
MVEVFKLAEASRINAKIEKEGNMKNSTLKGMLAAVIVLVALTGRPLTAAADGHESDGVHIVVTFIAGPSTAADPGTCDPTTFLPKAGDPVCIGTLAITTTASGDFVGTDLEEVTFAAFPDGSDSFTDFETWTGTLKGHGTGTFTLLSYDGVTQADGVFSSKLRILDGTGTGDLVGIAGMGGFASVTGVATMTLEFPGQHQHH